MGRAARHSSRTRSFGFSSIIFPPSCHPRWWFPCFFSKPVVLLRRYEQRLPVSNWWTVRRYRRKWQRFQDFSIELAGDEPNQERVSLKGDLVKSTCPLLSAFRWALQCFFSARRLQNLYLLATRRLSHSLWPLASAGRLSCLRLRRLYDSLLFSPLLTERIGHVFSLPPLHGPLAAECCADWRPRERGGGDRSGRSPRSHCNASSIISWRLTRPTSATIYLHSGSDRCRTSKAICRQRGSGTFRIYT